MANRLPFYIEPTEEDKALPGVAEFLDYSARFEALIAEGTEKGYVYETFEDDIHIKGRDELIRDARWHAGAPAREAAAALQAAEEAAAAAAEQAKKDELYKAEKRALKARIYGSE